jgi:hypothetical protein
MRIEKRTMIQKLNRDEDIRTEREKQLLYYAIVWKVR